VTRDDGLLLAGLACIALIWPLWALLGWVLR